MNITINDDFAQEIAEACRLRAERLLALRSFTVRQNMPIATGWIDETVAALSETATAITTASDADEWAERKAEYDRLQAADGLHPDGHCHLPADMACRS